MPNDKKNVFSKQTNGGIGFAPLSSDEAIREARIANLNDTEPTSVRDFSIFDHQNGKISKLTSTSYYVSEETQSRPFADNSSLQSVGYTQSYRGKTTTATATLTSERDGLINVLHGHSDGKVVLNVLTEDSKRVSLDVTEIAAKAGITAAGIRRTQQDIAKDGEVLRPEQQQIIDTIDKVKKGAGIR